MQNILTFAKGNFSHSKKYMESLVSKAGLKSGITEPTFEESDSSYCCTRIIKASV